MNCPECHASYEAGATVCTNCGLILLSAQEPPKRRAEDFASQRRRAADQVTSCQFCHGEISGKAIRCKHCGEIVNEDYYRDRARRLRARVNYASWVAYIFGLGALLVFRPVGLLSIAAGLLLSIAYYAIPVEPPQVISGKKQSLGKRLKRQLKLERVAIPIPHLKSKKLIFVGTPLVAALIGYSANLFLLQEPMNQVLKENSAFSGMDVSAHYEYWVVPGVVVYDLRDLTVRQTPIDVHTAFLEFAKKLRERRYRRVELSYHGVSKFEIDGSAFRRLGEEYARRNFDFVLYRFPHLFHSMNGNAAIPQNASDRDALLQFHREWYGNDAMTRTVANGL
ncbi:MAG TPA: TFIIB-type zinc ribbon-containing protein [Thermoanaerobaculia bacterium]|nr:TFIIB-type zinc ribbon-containing protein [Thermoanaerobaculia bacterium]